MRSKPRLPGLLARPEWRLQIGKCGWNCLEPRRKGPRQTRQRTMQIEIGEHGPGLRQAQRDAVDSREQRMDGILDFENDPRAALRNHRCVAGKLDGVAQSFVAVQKDSLARDRLVAKPERSGE